MDRFNLTSNAKVTELKLSQALSEAAANLQRAAYSEETIERVFHQQINSLGLRGGILLLDESKQRMRVISAAEGGQFQKILEKFEKTLGIKAKGFSFNAADVDVYRQVVESAEVVFVPDASIVIKQLLPDIARPIAGRIVKAFGGYPGIYAPLMSQGQVMGAVNIAGERLTQNEVPSIRAFASHVSAAYDNARLYTELKASENHFRSLIENATIGFYQAQPDGQILFANPALVKMLGYASFEELSQSNREQNALASKFSRKSIRKKLAKKGQVVGIEASWAGKDGATKFTRESVRVVKGSDGEITFYEGTVEDITEQIMAEDARKFSEIRFRSLIEQSPLSTILYSPEGYPLFGNAAAIDTWNIDPDMVDDVYENYNVFEDQQLIEAGIIPYLKKGFGGECIEIPAVAYKPQNQNSSRWIKGTVYPVMDQNQAVREVVLVQEDITDRVLAEKALRESEERYRTIFENSAVSLWEEDFSEVIADLDALADQGVDDMRRYLDEHPEFLEQAANKIKILDINETTLKMFGGSSKEEILGSPEKIFIPETQQILKEELLAIAEGQTHFGGETVNQTLLGEKKDVLLTMTIPSEREKLENVVVSVMDITRRVQAEERLKRQLSELAVLNQLANAGINSANEDELISRATQIIGESLFPQNFGIMLIDEQRRELYPHPSYWGISEHAMEIRVSLGAGSIAGVVAVTGNAKLVTDTRNEKDYLEVVKETRSELVVPLKVAGRVIGVINSESNQRGYFSDEDLHLMTTVAGQLSNGIERLRNDAAERELRQFNQALRASLTVINNTLDLEQIFDQIMDAVQLVVPYETANIMQIEDGEGKIFRHRGFVERGLTAWLDRVSYPLDEFPTIKSIVESGNVYHAADTTDNELWVTSPGEEWIYSYLGAPILLDGEVIGVINLNHSQPGFYTAGLGERLSAFSDHVAIAIKNARLYQEALDASDRRIVLYNASQEMIRASQDQNVIYEAIHRAVELVMHIDAFIISLVQPGNGEIKLVYAFEKAKRIPEQTIPAHSGLSGYVVDNNASVYIENIATYQGDFDVQTIGDPEYIQSLIAIPIQISDRTLGMLSAQSHTPNAYSDDDLYLLEMLGAHAAAVLENVELYNSAVDDANRWAALQKVSQEVVAASHDLDSAYQALHTATSRMMAADVFTITLLNEDKNEIELVYAYDGEERSPILSFSQETGLSGFLIENKQSLLIANLSEYDYDFDVIRFGEGEKVRSVLAVPIQVKEKVLGVLSAQSYAVNAYSTEDQFKLEMLASLAATVLDNATLYDQAQRRLDELEAISLITTALREAKRVDEMLPILLEQAAQVTRAAFGTIHLVDSVTGNLVVKRLNPPRPDLEGLSLRPGEGITGHVASCRKMYLTEDLHTDPIVNIRPEAQDFFENVAANLTLPMIASDVLVGVMNIGLPSGRTFSEEEIDLLTSITHIAANAIRRATLHEKTQQSLQRLSGLREIDQAISASLDLDFSLRVLIDHIIDQLKVDATSVLLYNPYTLLLEYSAGTGFRTHDIAQTQIRIDQGFAGHAVRERKLVSIPVIDETSIESPRKDVLLREGFTSYFGVPLSAKGHIVGLLEIFNRKQLEPDHDWIDFLETLAGQVAIAINNARLYQDLQLANQNLSLAYDRTLEGWALALELRDQETEGHSRRVTDMTIQLAMQLGIRDEELVHVRRGVLLHDIGKMGVPDRILLKKGHLTDDEWEIMRRHPTYAFEMLSQIKYLVPSMDIPYCHHEKWDGTGYPRGLIGDQIPLAARIFAVVDVWDALRSDRPYRDAWDDARIAEYIKDQSGTHFDPRVVEVFFQNWQPSGNGQSS